MTKKDTDPSRFPDDQYAAIIREMIRNEDSVLNQRVTWCVTIEGLLLAALAFAWNNARTAFVLVISAAAIFVATSALYAGIKTVKTMAKLTALWKSRCPPGYDGPPVIGLETTQWCSWLRPSRAIPGAFIILWIAIDVVRIFGR